MPDNYVPDVYLEMLRDMRDRPRLVKVPESDIVEVYTWLSELFKLVEDCDLRGAIISLSELSQIKGQIVGWAETLMEREPPGPRYDELRYISSVVQEVEDKAMAAALSRLEKECLCRCVPR